MLLLLACGPAPSPGACAAQHPSEDDPDFTRGLADFEAWSGEPACVPEFFLSDPTRPPYTEGVAAACEAWDRRHGASQTHTDVFTGAGVSGPTLEARQREDFVRSCQTLAGHAPSFRLAEEQFCGLFHSERLAVIRTLFPDRLIPVEPEPEVHLGTLDLPKAHPLRAQFAATHSMVLVSQRDVDSSDWTLRAFDIHDLQLLWTAQIDAFLPYLYAGLDSVLVEDAQMWRADRQGLHPISHPYGLSYVADAGGWWALNFTDGETHRWRFDSDEVEVLGPYDPGHVGSDATGMWISDLGGGSSVQPDTGARLEIEEAGGGRLDVRGGIAESHSGFIMVKRPGDRTRIRGAHCGESAYPVPGPLRLEVLSVDVDAEPGRPLRQLHHLTRLESFQASPGG